MGVASSVFLRVSFWGLGLSSPPLSGKLATLTSPVLEAAGLGPGQDLCTCCSLCLQLPPPHTVCSTNSCSSQVIAQFPCCVHSFQLTRFIWSLDMFSYLTRVSSLDLKSHKGRRLRCSFCFVSTGGYATPDRVPLVPSFLLKFTVEWNNVCVCV